MIELTGWLTAVGCRVTSGCRFLWACYGPHARFLDVELDDLSASASVVLDSETREIYEATVCDFQTHTAYRLINPKFRASFVAECANRQTSTTQAWDGVDFIDLELAEDMLAKTHAILNHESYDQRVVIQFELAESVYFALLKQAHASDITFNQLVTRVLQAQIDALA